MKTCYFLDKIYNANFKEFEHLFENLILSLGFKEFPHTIVKIENDWVIDIERGEDLITIRFNDYFMTMKNSQQKEKVDISKFWQNKFQTFLRKKQRMEYVENLNSLEQGV